MRKYKKSYFIKQAFTGFRRNGIMSAAAVFVLAACLLIMGSFSILIHIINYNVSQMDSLDSVVIFLKDGTEIDYVTEILDTDLSEYVSEYRVITKQEALEMEKEKYKDHPEIFEILGNDNPLPDSVEIKYSGVESLDNLIARLENVEGLEEYIKNNHETAETVSDMKQSVVIVFLWLWMILMVVAVFVIINTIKLSVHARAHEIEVMRYIGAANWFIVLPFVIEGVFIAICAFVLAYPLQWYIHQYVFTNLLKDISYITVPSFASMSAALAAAFALCGLIIGIFATSVSVRRYVHR